MMLMFLEMYSARSSLAEDCFQLRICMGPSTFVLDAGDVNEIRTHWYTWHPVVRSEATEPPSCLAESGILRSWSNLRLIGFVHGLMTSVRLMLIKDEKRMGIVYKKIHRASGIMNSAKVPDRVHTNEMIELEKSKTICLLAEIGGNLQER